MLTVVSCVKVVVTRTTCGARVVSRHCQPYIDFMTVKCQPFTLPWELSMVIINIISTLSEFQRE